jgi:hypothetical protein
MYRAKDTFWAPGNRRIVKGDLVAPHDPVVKAREELFEEVVIPRAVQPSEAATQQPVPEPVSEQVRERATDPADDGPGSPEPAAAGSDPAADAEPVIAAPAAARKTPAKKTTAAARKPAAGGTAK